MAVREHTQAAIGTGDHLPRALGGILHERLLNSVAALASRHDGAHHLSGERVDMLG
jgi:hypothetical protein